MNRADFIAHLRSGKPATEAVHKITGIPPEIVTVQEWDMPGEYTRYGVMMAGPLMAAIVILSLVPGDIDRSDMERIRAGEPCGAVLVGMTRRCKVVERGIAVQATASLIHRTLRVGRAQEVFTESLFK